MSLNYPEKLNTVAVYDPRTIITNQRDYAILKGGQSVNFKQYTTTSISNSSLSFSCPPPSGSIIVDRKVKLLVPIRLTLTGPGVTGQALLQPGRDGPRAFGLMKSLQTVIITINNQTVSMNMADIISALLHYNTREEVKMQDYSTTPTTQDQYQEYSSGFGTSRNSLGLYGDAQDQSMTGNAGFPSFNIISNAPGSGVAVVDIMFCENLFISPFIWGKHQAGGFYNVTTMDFTFNFLSGANGNRFWSHDASSPGGTITGTSFTIGGLNGGPTSFSSTTGNSPVMLFEYITPNQQQIVGPMTSIPYPLFDVQEYQTNGPTFGAYGSGTDIQQIPSNNIQLSSIPRRIYVYVRQQNQDFYSSCSNTDTFFQIQSVNVQFQNQSGLLNSANMIQLYDMSVKNHCQDSWAQWSGGPVISPAPWGITGPTGPVYQGTVGSVLCLEFGTDIALQDVLDAPGKLSASTLQIFVNCRNMAQSSITATLFIVTVSEGVFEVESLNRATQSIGVITSKDILDAVGKPGVDYQDAQDINGGDFFSGLKNFGQKIHDFIKQHKLVSRGLSAVGRVIPEARLATAPLGLLAQKYGYGEGEGEGVLVGGRRHYGRGEGVMAGVMAGEGEGVLVGGRAMHRRDLKQRMHKY